MKNDCKCRRHTLPVSRPFARRAIFIAGSLLLSGHSAFAQTLTVNSGSATVSSTGTAVSGSGTTFGGGATAATNNYMTGAAVGDGSSNPLPTAILNLQDGGSIQTVTASADGAADISGGTVGTAQAGYGGRINISGGTVQTASTGNNFGQVVISGGTVQNANDGTGLSSFTNSLLISGGTVGAVSIDRAGVNIEGGLVTSIISQSQQTGTVHISGGSVQTINTPNNIIISGGIINTAHVGEFDSTVSSTVTDGTIGTLDIAGGDQNQISGGTITHLISDYALAHISISGGSFQFIDNIGSRNVINITGTGLQEIGTPTDAAGDGTFHLIGTLTDGQALDAQYTQQPSTTLEFDGGTVVSTPVPEASTLASLGLMLVSGLGLTLRSRKSRTF